MTEKEAIEILEEVKELDDTMYAYNPAYMNALDMAIEALEEIQLYKDNKLCLIPEDVYSKQCEELDAYKEIGTVEECREAVIKAVDRHTREDETLDDDISVILEEVKTVFDKEKVIEKLKDQYNYSRKVRNKNNNIYFEYWDGRTDSYKDAIEIVEKGGIE